MTQQSCLELEDAVRGASVGVLAVAGEGRAFCPSDDLRAFGEKRTPVYVDI